MLTSVDNLIQCCIILIMKNIPLNKNSNWYTARFTDITVIGNTVIFENYFTSEKHIIEDKKFATKISMYLYSDQKNGKFHWYEMNNRIEKWVSNRKTCNKYDNIENNWR